MKTTLLAILFFATLGKAVAQDAGEPENFIVVIGAFASQDNANRFVKQTQKYKIKPSVELNKIRGLYYVYVLQTGDKTNAMIEAERLREETPLTDTWVYKGSLGDVLVREPVVVPVPVEQPPVQEIKIEVAETPPPPPPKTEAEKIKDAVDSKSMVLKKGETETLDHLFFYRDAAVLRPESQYEVDRLVRLMKEHPDANIKIHGHTNGNDKGRIIRMAKGSTNFFSLDNTIEDYGSAVKLSELRANVIKDYLVTNGIDAKRMSIKAWGGKKPLYEVDDEKAEANVRVDVEVLSKD